MEKALDKQEEDIWAPGQLSNSPIMVGKNWEIAQEAKKAQAKASVDAVNSVFKKGKKSAEKKLTEQDYRAEVTREVQKQIQE